MRVALSDGATLIKILRNRSVDSAGGIFRAQAALHHPTAKEFTEVLGRSEEAV
ncbi:hypothetical protein [Streptomyces sp. MMBL 11-3]|uniref:hypothetical protein n=1 Tax=Streptomyces sp. MMBL 11-3 TaxID=3382639 RepID=UPI0039B4660B